MPGSVGEALRAVGHPGDEPPRRPVLRHAGATLLTLATLDAQGRPVWHGLWLGDGPGRALGPAVAACALASRASVPEASRPVVDLVAASSLSILERLEHLGGELDRIEAAPEPVPLAALSGLQRGLAAVRKHLFRLELLLGELEGPLGRRFDGIAVALPELSSAYARSAQLATGMQQTARDLLSLRAAVEANRLAETSNEIAALANTSNLRMLGVAYVALALALVSAVVLIPNTAATILGMPSAAWVPGPWVDVALAVLAVVPLAVVFSRPWVRRMLHGWGDFERRSAEGLADLPELSPTEAREPAEAERLIRERP